MRPAQQFDLILQRGQAVEMQQPTARGAVRRRAIGGMDAHRDRQTAAHHGLAGAVAGHAVLQERRQIAIDLRAKPVEIGQGKAEDADKGI